MTREHVTVHQIWARNGRQDEILANYERDRCRILHPSRTERIRKEQRESGKAYRTSLRGLSASARRRVATVWCGATTQSTEEASAANGIPGVHHTSPPPRPTPAPVPPLTPAPPPLAFRLSLPFLRRLPRHSSERRGAGAPTGALAWAAAADAHPSGPRHSAAGRAASGACAWDAAAHPSPRQSAGGRGVSGAMACDAAADVHRRPRSRPMPGALAASVSA